jgi:hypothetical protein
MPSMLQAFYRRVREHLVSVLQSQAGSSGLLSPPRRSASRLRLRSVRAQNLNEDSPSAIPLSDPGNIGAVAAHVGAIVKCSGQTSSMCYKPRVQVHGLIGRPK